MRHINFRQDIQGLRAIAVLAVLIFHLNKSYLPGGFVGVDIFFVISGFLIASILLRNNEVENKKSIILYFYFARFKRIFPAYFFTLSLTTICAIILFTPLNYEQYQSSLYRAGLFISNVFFAGFGDYFATNITQQPLLHTWSLAVEIQFYLFVPFLFLFFTKRTIKVSLVVVSLVLIVWSQIRLQILNEEQAAYYSVFSRIPEFFIGAYIGCLKDEGKRYENKMLSYLGFGLIILSCLFIAYLKYFPGIAALAPALGAALLILNDRESLVIRILSNRWMVWIGTLSYSLYLFHWPVLSLMRYYTGEYELTFFLGCIFLLVTFLLSLFSYYYVEVPFRTRKKETKKSKARAIELFCEKKIILLFLTISMLVLYGKEINASIISQPTKIELIAHSDEINNCHDRIVRNCIRGNTKSNKELLVLGDSHAARLNDFFSYLGSELGFKAKIISASSCVTIPGFDYQRLPKWAQRPCKKQIEKVSSLIKDASLIVISGSWIYQTQSPDFLQALSNFFDNLEEWQQVYILSDVPHLLYDPQRSYRFHKLGLNDKIDKTIHPDWLKANERIKSLSGKFSNVEYLDLSGAEVFRTVPVYKGKLIYTDSGHITSFASFEYGRESEEIFRSIIDGSRKPSLKQL